ncbi:MAG TPA: sigma-54 dependent transcriptional regulator [Vicinamibacterales bacterium]|nr:sigma-54 dependent transcriptional regulator [Vicinamibacterales bacterium]
MTGKTCAGPRLIGASPAIRALDDDIELAARSDARVLITGETGVGKEIAAHLIHRGSARSQNTIATLNCAGLPDSLLASELFGHVRGSFTGAYRDKLGLLESAPNGTLFLDEVGDMSVRMQLALLRFLDTGELQRVGADRGKIVANARVIAATNRDLEADIAAGRFRADLYYRLNVIRLHIPPLRERREDVPALANYFLATCAAQHQRQRVTLAPQTMDLLVAHDWPGNIRQLRNVVERACIKASGPVIGVTDLPADISRVTTGAATPSTPIGVPESAAALPSVDDLLARIIRGGESFWSAVYEPFMRHDLSRCHVRALVARGLEHTRGNYKILVSVFNMPPADYKRFLNFLRKFDCHLPFHTFRPPQRWPLSSAASPIVTRPLCERVEGEAGRLPH